MKIVITWMPKACLGGGKNDFVVGVGIFFYDGTTGEAALRKVYENIDAVLKENSVYGHYAFCVKKGSSIYAFNDMSGMMRLYYYQDADGITVSTSMLSVVATIKEPKFDKVRLATNLTAKNIPFVQGVELFNFYKYLQIDGKQTKWNDRNISDIKRIGNHEEAVKYVKGLFEEQVKELKPIGDERINIELTGGLDSRLTASVLKSGGFNYGFVHFPGLNKRDTDISNKIAQGLGADLDLQVDSKKLTPNEFESVYGEFDFCFNFFNHHANARRVMKNRYQFTGGYGEDIDTPQIYTIESREVSALTENAVVKPTRKALKKKTRRDVVNGLTKLYSEYGFEAGKWMKDREYAYFTAVMDASLGGDSRTISAYNAVAVRYGMFSEYHFRHHVMDIDFEAKRNRRLTLSLIAAIDPELGSYPFSSHMLTTGESVNEAAKHPFHYKSRANLKSNLPDFVLDWYKKRQGAVFDTSLYKNIDFSLYDDIVNTRRIKKYPGVYRDVLQRLYSIDLIRRVMGIKM